jgi:hypothetical protein
MAFEQQFLSCNACYINCQRIQIMSYPLWNIFHDQLTCYLWSIYPQGPGLIRQKDTFLFRFRVIQTKTILFRVHKFQTQHFYVGGGKIFWIFHEYKTKQQKKIPQTYLVCKIWGFHGVTPQKTPFFIVTAVKSLNLTKCSSMGRLPIETYGDSKRCGSRGPTSATRRNNPEDTNLYLVCIFCDTNFNAIVPLSKYFNA